MYYLFAKPRPKCTKDLIKIQVGTWAGMEGRILYRKNWAVFEAFPCVQQTNANTPTRRKWNDDVVRRTAAPFITRLQAPWCCVLTVPEGTSCGDPRSHDMLPTHPPTHCPPGSSGFRSCLQLFFFINRVKNQWRSQKFFGARVILIVQKYLPSKL